MTWHGTEITDLGKLPHDIESPNFSVKLFPSSAANTPSFLVSVVDSHCLPGELKRQFPRTRTSEAQALLIPTSQGFLEAKQLDLRASQHTKPPTWRSIFLLLIHS
jgi:hypothetical protein